ncbi:MAG TPA: RsmE family RNA methyltransferase [Fluviicola sp.]|nr:RsmE family RNA methyltransferase [Fluviicola sp.]
MRRFFLSAIPETTRFHLPEEESKHIVRVLRMTVGEELLLLDGKGKLLTARIMEDHPKRCLVESVSVEQKQKPDREFHLAIAPTKNLDRMEWMVEKIVEIGATRLSFLQGDHSERVNLKLERLERVAISAMKQAQHDFLLQLDPLETVDAFIARFPVGGIAHCMEGEKDSLLSVTIDGPVLIGPEGDFSKREVELALKSGYKALHLGESRLRTETAGLVATTLAIASKER